GRPLGRLEVLWMKEVVGAALDDRVPAEPLRLLERGLRIRRVARPEQRDAAVVLHDRALLALLRGRPAQVLKAEPLQLRDAPLRRVAEGRLDLPADLAGKPLRNRWLAGGSLWLVGGRPRVEREPDYDPGRDERGGGDGEVNGGARLQEAFRRKGSHRGMRGALL